MKLKEIIPHLTMKSIIVVGLIVVFIITFQAVDAALYKIKKNDATVQEWFDQSIPVFQTDPAGDVPVADEDIIQTWVATGDDNTFNFMMQLNADPALDSQWRQAAAYIDCDMDGEIIHTIHTLGKEYSRVIMISGDSDMKDSLDYIRDNYDVEVWIVSHQENLSNKYSDHNVISIEDLLKNRR